MFTKCGNPACQTAFDSRRGRIFVSDTAASIDSTYTVQLPLHNGLCAVHYFWLCARCCSRHWRNPEEPQAGAIGRERPPAARVGQRCERK